jgi:predicted MFS family arabinose efflux permease
MQDCAAPWLMSELTTETRLVAATQAATMLAVCCAVLIAGALADTVDARRFLMATQAAACIVALAVGVLVVAGMMGPWLLLGLTAVMGLGHGALLIGVPGVVRQTGGGHLAATAGSAHAAQLSSRQSGGAVLGGVVLATAGAAAAFFLTAAAFLAVALSLRRLPARRRTAPVSPRRVAAALGVGVRTVLLTPTVRNAIALCVLLALGAAALWSLLVPYVRGDLRLDALGLGLLQTAAGVGGIAGVVLVRRLPRQWSTAAVVAGMAALLLAAFLVLALAPMATVAVFALAAAGFAWFALVVLLSLTVQVAVPEHLRARTLALELSALYLATAAGCLIWGHVGSAVGVRVSLLAAAGVVGAVALLTAALPIGRLLVGR